MKREQAIEVIKSNDIQLTEGFSDSDTIDFLARRLDSSDFMMGYCMALADVFDLKLEEIQ